MADQGVQTVTGTQIPLDLATILDMAAKNALTSRGLDLQDVQGQRNYELQRAEFNRLGQEAAQQYALDVANLGLQTASLNYQKRLATAQNALTRGQLGVSAANVGISDSAQGYAQRQGRANTKLASLQLLADRSGPQDWVAYNYLKDKMGAPTGQAVDPTKFADDLVDPRYEQGGGGVVGDWRSLIPSANSPEFDMGPDVQAPQLAPPQTQPSPPPASAFTPTAPAAPTSWYVDNGSSGWQSTPWSTGPSPDDPAANFSGIRAADVKPGRNLLTSGAGGAFNFSDLLAGLTLQDAQGNSYTNQSAGQGTPSTAYWVVAPEGYAPAMAGGGPTTAPLLLTGDKPSGRGPHDEMIWNPTGAPLHIMDHGLTNRFMDAMKAEVKGDSVVLGREQGKRPFERRARGTGLSASNLYGNDNPTFDMGAGAMPYGDDQRGGDVSSAWAPTPAASRPTPTTAANPLGSAIHSSPLDKYIEANGAPGIDYTTNYWETPTYKAALAAQAADQGAAQSARVSAFKSDPSQIKNVHDATDAGLTKWTDPTTGFSYEQNAGWAPGSAGAQWSVYGSPGNQVYASDTGSFAPGRGSITQMGTLGLRPEDAWATPVTAVTPNTWAMMGPEARAAYNERLAQYGTLEDQAKAYQKANGVEFGYHSTPLDEYIRQGPKPEPSGAPVYEPSGQIAERAAKMTAAAPMAKLFRPTGTAPTTNLKPPEGWNPVAQRAAFDARNKPTGQGYFDANPLDSGQWIDYGGYKVMQRDPLSNVKMALKDAGRDPNSAGALLSAFAQYNDSLPANQKHALGYGETLVGDLRQYGNALMGASGFDANAIPHITYDDGTVSGGGALRNEKDALTYDQAMALEPVRLAAKSLSATQRKTLADILKNATSFEEGLAQARQFIGTGSTETPEAAAQTPNRSAMWNFGLQSFNKGTMPRYASGTQSAWSSATQPGYYGMPESPYYLKYSPSQLGNQPFYKKLTGGMPSTEFSGWGNTKISNPSLGVSDAPTLLNLQTWRDMDVTDREQTEGLYQQGLGVDFRDILERSSRGSPIGVSFGAARYGGR